MRYRADKHVVTAHTDGHTDSQTQATTIPESQNWPRVINPIFCVLTCAIIYFLIHQIIFRFCLLKYSLFFFKYSCTNIFHRRSLCTFYSTKIISYTIFITILYRGLRYNILLYEIVFEIYHIWNIYYNNVIWNIFMFYKIRPHPVFNPREPVAPSLTWITGSVSRVCAEILSYYWNLIMWWWGDPNDHSGLVGLKAKKYQVAHDGIV